MHAVDLAGAAAAALGEIIGDAATVFHLAADASVAGGKGAFDNNVRSTAVLIEALRSRSPTRVVYASSIGAVDRAPSDRCDTLLDESTPPHPLTRYGESKLAGERAFAASGLPSTIVRPTWVYGAGRREVSHLRVLLDMVRSRGLAARVRFPGRVSVIHVDDLCGALILAATHPDAAGQCFFASDGAPIAIGELFALIGEFTGRSAATISVPRPVAAVARLLRPILPLAAQNLNSDVLAAANGRLDQLGFRARVPLHRGLIELARSVVPARGQWIVTGAASGIGRALAVQLHADGASVIAVDRDNAALQSLASDCTGTVCVAADLSTTDGRARLVQTITSAERLEGVVNCAGIGARGRVGDIAPAAERALIGVNVEAVADGTSAAIAKFRTGTSGTLVNVASSAAFQPLPFMAAYAASKAFVLSYTEAAAAEVAGENVRVIAVCPGGTDTHFQMASGVRRLENERLMRAADVAERIFAAINRGESATVFVGARTGAMALLARVLPRRTVTRVWAKMMGALR